MPSIFIRNFAILNFLKVFYFVIIYYGRIWAETCRNLSLNKWQYLCCDRWFICEYYFLVNGRPCMLSLYFSLYRRDLMSITCWPDKLYIAIYSHQSRHHEIHVRVTMKLETVNVSLLSP